jgi:hypothetical protein
MKLLGHSSLYVASVIAHAGDVLCFVLATVTLGVACLSHEMMKWQRKQTINPQPWIYDVNDRDVFQDRK